jgi:hypothetical protein
METIEIEIISHPQGKDGEQVSFTGRRTDTGEEIHCITCKGIQNAEGLAKGMYYHKEASLYEGYFSNKVFHIKRLITGK